MTFGPHDSLTLRYVLTNNGNEIWTLTLPGHPPIQTRVVGFAGDSLITQAESVASILGSERVMTRLRTVLHYGGHTLTGSIEVRYPPPSGAVVRGRTRATLDCPGTDSPKAVVAFVRRAGLPKVRCMTETAGGALLGGEGTVHQVTYRRGTSRGTLPGRRCCGTAARAGSRTMGCQSTPTPSGCFARAPTIPASPRRLSSTR